MSKLPVLAALAALGALLPAAAGAQAPLPLPAADLLRYVQTQAAAAVGDAGARIEVALGQLDPRLQLAPCARVEPFLPANARLWGRSRVGLRCAAGANWSVQMPVTVRVFGPALVATRPLAVGEVPAAADLRTAEIEWTREPQGVATDAAQLDGRVLARAVAAGQPLPLAALRAPQVIAAGDPVRLLGQGEGFTVAADAVALGAALDGQPVRVRTDSGRIMTGTARNGRRVEVSF